MTSMVALSLSLLLCLFGLSHGQNSHACPSSVMEGVGLGGLVKIKTNATDFKACCNMCSEKSMCVAWTFLTRENICLLRDEHGKRMMKHQYHVSGIMQSAALPAPSRHKNLLIYVGVLSAPGNRGKVKYARVLCYVMNNNYEQFPPLFFLLQTGCMRVLSDNNILISFTEHFGLLVNFYMQRNSERQTS